MLALVLVGALSQLADQVAQAAPAKGEISVAVGGPGRLGTALEELVVGRLRERGRVAQPPPGAADATIECTVAIRGDQLVVEGRVRRVDAELWRAAVGAAGGDVIGRVFVQAPADAEAKSLVATPQAANPPTRKFGGAVRTIPLGDVEVVALAVGKDGAINALTEREILTVREGKPIAHAPIPLAMAPLTSRALMGGIVGSTIGLSTRVGSIPVGLSPDGRPLSAAVDVTASALMLPAPWPQQRIHAAATGTVGGQWFGATVDENGQLVVYRGAPGAGNVHFMVPGAGDAVAIWDADGDGDPEVATSSRVPLGENDEIVVRNARGDVMRKPITGTVTALAASDNALYAAVRDASGKTQLWIVQ
jgi:hypothetical protein